MEFSSSNLTVNSPKRTLGIIIAIVVLIIVIILVALSQNGFVNSPSEPTPSSDIMTDEEKIRTLESIPVVEVPMTDEEKIKTLESIPVVEVPMTDEEKIKILNSI